MDVSGTYLISLMVSVDVKQHRNESSLLAVTLVFNLDLRVLGEGNMAAMEAFSMSGCWNYNLGSCLTVTRQFLMTQFCAVESLVYNGRVALNIRL